jgi:hypothetical protein
VTRSSDCSETPSRRCARRDRRFADLARARARTASSRSTLPRGGQSRRACIGGEVEPLSPPARIRTARRSAAARVPDAAADPERLHPAAIGYLRRRGGYASRVCRSEPLYAALQADLRYDTGPLRLLACGERIFPGRSLRSFVKLGLPCHQHTLTPLGRVVVGIGIIHRATRASLCPGDLSSVNFSMSSIEQPRR